MVSVLVLGTVNPPKCVDQSLGAGFKRVFKSSNVLKQVQNNLGESIFAKCVALLILDQINQTVLLGNSQCVQWRSKSFAEIDDAQQLLRLRQRAKSLVLLGQFWHARSGKPVWGWTG